MSSLSPSSHSIPSLFDTPHFFSLFESYLSLTTSNGEATSDTKRTYRSNLKQFLLWCAENSLNPLEIKRNDVKKYRFWLIEVQKYSHATISLKLSVVRTFYNALVDAEYLIANPALGIKPPKQTKDSTSRIKYLQETEVSSLLHALPTDNSVHSLRDRLLISIMILEGTRTVEMHRVSLKDIVKDGDNVGLKVQAKGSIRVVPLTPQLAQLLRQYLAKRRRGGESLTPDSPIFISIERQTYGKRLSRRSIQRLVDKYLIKIGLKEKPKTKGQKTPEKPNQTAKKNHNRQLSAHTLRHTCGTLAIQANASIKQVQDLLGHADPRTTMVYAQIADKWASNPGLLLERSFSYF